jgi:hypothetical protein
MKKPACVTSSTTTKTRKPRRARAVVVEYLRHGKKTQLSIFDILKKDPAPLASTPTQIPAAPSTPPEPAALCFECGRKLHDDEIDIGICTACFSPRR